MQRFWLGAAIILIATRVDAQLDCSTPDAPGAFPSSESLLAADRAFAAASVARGAPAWAESWTDRGKLYGTAEFTASGPQDTARKIAGMVDHLRWEPVVSSMLWPDSAGYTVGRWWAATPERGSDGGCYLTVWRRVDGRWKVALHVWLPAQDESRPASDFDFWVGDWILEQRIWSGEGDSYEPYSGRSQVRKVNDGSALIESYEGDVRFFWTGMDQPKHIRGMSVRFYDPDDEQWRIFWMDTLNPRFGLPFKGGFSETSGEFLLTDRPNGLPPSRIVFTPRADGTVDWHLDIRTSGSGQWQPLWKITFQSEGDIGLHEVDEEASAGEPIPMHTNQDLIDP